MGSLHSMNKEEFVNFVKMHIRDEASAGLIQKLEKPPGRKPRAKLVAQSKWFNNLDSKDKEMVSQIIHESIDEALFGLLSVLDGVSAIYEKPGSEWKLIYKNKDQEKLLNDIETESLHDLYNDLTLED
ncbi:MAG: RusA family crossover junction endodeoxyribonuclease [Shouchella clausii]|jgi:predicted house-cleaning noncanonical NTP pyrophosphatase (MazG superfamily)